MTNEVLTGERLKASELLSPDFVKFSKKKGQYTAFLCQSKAHDMDILKAIQIAYPGCKIQLTIM